MPDTQLQMVFLFLGRNVDAKILRGLGLANARNIVAFAFDCEKCGLGNFARINWVAVGLRASLSQGLVTTTPRNPSGKRNA